MEGRATPPASATGTAPVRPARPRRRLPLSFLVSGSSLFGPLLLLALAVLTTIGYQRWADARDARRYPPPGVLVGSGLGGYSVRLFASRHPRDVAGLVLVDTMSEERAPQSDQNEALIRTIGWVGTLGIVRAKAELTGAGWSRVALFPQSAWPLVSALTLRTTAFRATGDEWLALEQSASQVRAERAAFPPVPLVVLTPGAPRGAGGRLSTPPERSDSISQDDGTPTQWRYWRDEHARLARMSPRGRHLIADETNAPFALSHPDVVARAISDVVDEVRRQ